METTDSFIEKKKKYIYTILNKIRCLCSVTVKTFVTISPIACNDALLVMIALDTIFQELLNIGHKCIYVATVIFFV